MVRTAINNDWALHLFILIIIYFNIIKYNKNCLFFFILDHSFLSKVKVDATDRCSEVLTVKEKKYRLWICCICL